MKNLKLSEFKEIKKLTGLNPKELAEALESGDYGLYTDAEADEMAHEYIKESLWAFNPSFLQAHLKDGIDADLLAPIQRDSSEDANELIKALIEDLDHLIEDAVCCDGRGHFLSTYDGEEIEIGKFYLYRFN